MTGETAAAPETALRRPDAVVLPPPIVLPSPATRANAHGVVSLRAPLGGDAVTIVVQAVVAAWQHESLDALMALLTADAQALDASGHGRAGLTEAFRQRLQGHDYTRLAGVQLVRPDRIEQWEWDELGAADAPARPPEMHPGETYVQAPLEVTREAGEKLFGDAIVLVIRREEGKLLIAAYGEIDTPAHR